MAGGETATVANADEAQAPKASRRSGIPPSALAQPIDRLKGIVMDLRSFNPKMHALKPQLWNHVRDRAEVLLQELQSLVEERRGDTA